MGIINKLEILEWTDARKCLVISLIAVVFSFFYLLFIFFLSLVPEILPQVNRSFLKIGASILPFVLISWILITFWAASVVKKEIEQPLLVYITLLWYGIPNVLLVYALGPVTNPFVGTALLGTAIVSIMLFNIKPALLTFSAVMIAVIVLTVLERMNVIPYAPLLNIAPTVDGRPTDLWVASFGSISLLIILAIVAAFLYITIQLRAREQELELLSNTDALTGLNNRRYFIDIASQEFLRAQRSGKPISLMMCDADHFKKVNDTWGHQVGDEVLKFISNTLMENSRRGIDFIGRLGGEEFAIVSADTDEKEAILLAERMLTAMREHTFTVGEESFQVTLSMGLAVLNDNHEKIEDLIALADKRLYLAKNKGRDCLIGSDQA